MIESVLFVDDLKSSSSAVGICRICHEQEFKSCKILESPCYCSGTVKFAHRDCVQRWCNEKGNTTCEICLQKFEPGYTSPPPKKIQIIDATVTIRGRLEVARNENEENSRDSPETEDYDCESADDKSVSCCKSMALIFTAVLLTRHLFDVLTGGVGPYPFSLLTVLLVKSSAIILPIYILILITTLLHNSIRHHYLNTSRAGDEDEEQDSDTETQV